MSRRGAGSALTSAQLAAGATGAAGIHPSGGLLVGLDGRRIANGRVVSGSLGWRPRLGTFGNSINDQSAIAYAGGGVFNNASGANDTRSGVSSLTISSTQSFNAGDKFAYKTYSGEVETNTVASATSVSTAVPLTNKTKRAIRAGANGPMAVYTTPLPGALRQSMGFISIANAMLGTPFEIINPTYAYGGATLEQMVLDLPTYLQRTRPDYVWLQLTENSISLPEDWTAIKPWLLLALNFCRKWSTIPIVGTALPSNSYNTASMCATFDSIKAYMTGTGPGTMAADYPEAIGVNCSDAWRDVSQDAGNFRKPLANLTDGIHPNTDKRYTTATATNNGATSIVAQFAAFAPTYTGDRTAGCLTSNPTLTGTAGARTGGGTVTGQVATGYTLNAAAGTVVTCSKNGDDSQKIVVAWATGDHNNKKVELDGPALNMSATAGTGNSSFGSANYVQAFVRLKINSQAGMMLVYPELQMSTGETYSCAQNETNWPTDPAAQGVVLDFECPAVPISDGATTAKVVLWLRSQDAFVNAAIDVDVSISGIRPATVS